jgi:Papain-like cysteine protease AvrRpt2
MAELLATDSDGEQHFIWTQEHNDTCGPACVYMIERMLRCNALLAAKSASRSSHRCSRRGITTARAPNRTRRSNKSWFVSALPSAARHVTNVGQFVSEGFFPFIARVGWKSGGGHFVVGAKTTNSGRLVCMDPWYGLVEPVISTLPLYPHSGSLSGHVIFPNASLQARQNLPSGAGWLSPPAG